jgi:hypothetical protein
MPMVVAPYIFSQIQRQSFPADSTLGRQLSFQISLKNLQAINMVAFFIYILFLAMVNQPMNIILERFSGWKAPTKTTPEFLSIAMPQVEGATC